MNVFAKTDLGKARDINQDYYYISDHNDEIQLYILADGMGGYNGGEIASRLATDSAKSYLKNNFGSIDYDRESILKLIENAIEYANMVVYEKSKSEKELEGMGTTLEICLIYNNKVYIGHIGDSRIYRIRKNFIRRLTVDHSYVEKLVKDGTITREESYTHPKKNMLTKALGCSAYIEPDVTVKGFLKEDVLLICSDGLTNMVSEDEIFREVKQDIKQAADTLIYKANQLGGYDNATVVIIENN